MLIALFSLIGLVIVAYLLFINFNPAFGGDVSAAQQKQYERSPNYKNGAFANKKNVPEDLSFGETLKIARKFFFTKVTDGSPDKDIVVEKTDSTAIAGFKNGTRLIWFGHSAFLLQINGKNILLDPMLGDVPAPHPWLGRKRFGKELPIEIEKLPEIDAVIISHDHYDHLDYGSIIKLKDKVRMFYMPLGVGVHLKAWGIEDERIVELDWWQHATYEDLTFRCTPAQHFSGRKFSNRQHTLWSSWIIQSPEENIFFSGDGGYGPHFKEIGEKFGPFDFAMMECGQYNEMWPDIHMFPEETARAGLDIKARRMMPIHWGAFRLALHSWTDPVERVIKKADELNLPVVTPKIGASVFIKTPDDTHTSPWWK